MSISCHRAGQQWNTNIEALGTCFTSEPAHTLVSQRNRVQGSHSKETPSNSINILKMCKSCLPTTQAGFPQQQQQAVYMDTRTSGTSKDVK